MKRKANRPTLPRIATFLVVILLNGGCFFSHSSRPGEAKNGVSLQLSAAKNSFRFYEDIEVFVVLENRHHHDWTIQRFYPSANNIGKRSGLVFTFSEGRRPKYVHTERTKKMHVTFGTKVLARGKRIKFKVNLKDWYDMRPGKYMVTARYAISAMPGPPARGKNVTDWHVESRPLEIVVKP